MEPDNNKLKQTTLIFIINLMMTGWSLTIAINSFGGASEWKKAASITGFLGLLTLTGLVFFQVLKLRRMQRSNQAQSAVPKG